MKKVMKLLAWQEKTKWDTRLREYDAGVIWKLLSKRIVMPAKAGIPFFSLCVKVILFILLTASPVLASSKVTPIQPLLISVDHGVNLTLNGSASSVFIANPDIADIQVMSPSSVMIFGKRTGETSFMATDSQGRVLEQRTVRVTQDLSDLRQELDLAIPGNKIHASALPSGLVLTGEAKDAATVADAYKMAQRYIPSGGDIINRIRVVGSNQIHIRVRFAEVSRKVDNTFGIDWNSAATFGGFTFGLASGAAIARDSTTGNILRPNNSTITLPNDVIGLTHVGQRTNINNLIDALAQDGLVTILAEPNLTAMSGETASFLAGGEIPVPIPQATGSNGVPLITVEWKNYGVSLQFTPTLIGQNRISLHVKPEVSQLTTTGEIVTDGITIPGLLTRKAETTVEVASGQSFAIAGLMDNNQAQTVNKFPILGDLPILGALFRSSEFQNNQTELVVIITPYVVTPNGEQQLALPMDGLSPPSESERLIGQRFSTADPNARPQSGSPVAVRDVTPMAAESPAPQAAPVMPVTPTEAPLKLNPQRVAPHALTPDENAAPAGSAGFIME